MGDTSFDDVIHNSLSNIMRSRVQTIRDSSLMFGLGGIAYTFLKAYESFKNEKYKLFASKLINNIHYDKVRENLSLSSGITGIGYILLEASVITQNQSYKEKAFKIARYLQNLHLSDEKNALYWYSDVSRKISAGLFHGNSGILLFLYQCTMHDNYID